MICCIVASIQVISHYDDVNNFDFNPAKKQIQFTILFNWNIIILEEQKQEMVHEEVSIPKESLLASKSYIGTINGIDVTKNLMVDPSNRTKDVVHFMLPKPVIIQLAEQVNNNNNRSASNGLMEFTLQPTSSAPTSMTMAGTQT